MKAIIIPTIGKLAPLVAAAIALAGCGVEVDSRSVSPEVPARAPDIAGIVTHVSPASTGRDGSLRIEEYPAEPNKGAKAVVRIKASTRFLVGHGRDLRAADVQADLTGARAKAWFIGPVAESWPVQATGDVVVVEAK